LSLVEIVESKQKARFAFTFEERLAQGGKIRYSRKADWGTVTFFEESFEVQKNLPKEERDEENEKFRKRILRDHLDEFLIFFADRLKVALREKGTRHDLIDAVFSLGNEDDLVRLIARVEALQSFLKTDEGANLLAGYKRAANILKAEEKKDKTTFDGAVDASLLALPEEKALAEALGAAEKAIAADVQAEQFVEAMGVMAGLRKPVDAFFDKVTVNDKDANLRENRLKLLARLRATLHLVADFSKIEG
jgi:glycyl-tRNA synthetase beta chain